MEFEHHVFVFAEDIAFDVPQGEGLDTTDELRPEIQQWLNANCTGRWRFEQFLGEDVDEVQEGGELVSGPRVLSRVEFTSPSDAMRFMQRMLAQAGADDK
jgi:hypothetical protein